MDAPPVLELLPGFPEFNADEDPEASEYFDNEWIEPERGSSVSDPEAPKDPRPNPDGPKGEDEDPGTKRLPFLPLTLPLRWGGGNADIPPILALLPTFKPVPLAMLSIEEAREDGEYI